MNTRFTILLSTIALIISAFGLLLSVPIQAQAQTLSLESARTSYKPGESFLVEATLDTLGKSINTVSGSIAIPANFSVSDIRSGNSVITIWITNPSVNAQNSISFVGGTPSGYTGSHGTLFSFVLTAKQEGTFSLMQKDIKILLNDGNGTEAKSQAAPLTLTISSQAHGSSTSTFVAGKDTTPPESFEPLVSKDPNVADNAFFVSFFAVDKDSGISHYDITEKPFLWFSTSSTTENSPFILNHQVLPEKITIKAYDRAGNMTEATVSKPGSKLFYIIIVAVLFIIFLFLYRAVYRRKNI